MLDQAEEADDGSVRLMFGTVAADWLQGLLAQAVAVPRDPAGRTRFFVAMPLYLLEIKLSAEDVAAIGGPDGSALPSQRLSGGSVGPTLTNLERRWVRIELSAGGMAAELFDNLFGAPIPVQVGSIRPTMEDESQLLDELDPLDGISDASVAEIENALASAGAVDEIAVYDVGQGAANGLISGREVACYFDFGGGVAGNTKTFPKNLVRFCQCNTPPIILSHWDHDHWSSEPD